MHLELGKTRSVKDSRRTIPFPTNFDGNWRLADERFLDWSL
ncbi:hypothetical protein P0S91_25485 (plasmid) [Gloeocapsopsis dulcis]|nr:hypothetical protein P0S91_25485 [Gloeocapsopsis dulcis]